MTSPNNSILEKIRACLALGDKERNPSQQEAETAIRMAKKLMQDYNLSMADVSFHEQEQTLGKMGETKMRWRAGIPSWEIDLARVSNNLFNTRHYIDRNHPEGREGYTQVCFYGYEADVAISAEVYKLLKLEILTMARNWEVLEGKANPWLSPGQLRGRRFSYCDGVVLALCNRSFEAVEGLSKQDASKVRDLVVRKDEAVEQWGKKTLGLVRRTRRFTNRHEDAHSDGLTDGQNISLDFDRTIHSKNSSPLSIEHIKEGK